MELTIHKESIRHGDDIRIIAEEKLKSVEQLPDFWMIDDTTVLVMKYGEKGEYKGFDIIEDSIQKYIDFKKFVWEKSKSLVK